MYVDACRFTPSAGGSADFAVSSAVTGYMTPASAGAVDTGTYYYRAESADLSQWEVGIGTYSAGSPTLQRTTVLFNSSGTTSKINFSAAPQVALVALAEGLRERLAAARTYYVRTDGSDSNSGLVNSAAGAFATLQKAVDTVTDKLDTAGFAVTISCPQTGATFSTGVSMSRPVVGGGTITISGDTTTPSNVTISTAGTCITVQNAGVALNVQGLKFVSLVAHGIEASFQGQINVVGNVEFGACGSAQIHATYGGVVDLTNVAYTISGNAGRHYWTEVIGSMIRAIDAGGKTITIVGSLTFTVFAQSDFLSCIAALGQTFSASVTGQRYLISLNAAINTFGGGANYFPGSVVGSTGTGGQYG